MGFVVRSIASRNIAPVAFQLPTTKKVAPSRNAVERFLDVVKQGETTAAPNLGHSVHVDVSGLEPDRDGRREPADGAAFPQRNKAVDR
jgi:hypothetical protein